MFHNNTQWGNFLYHEVKKGGYYHYRINNTDFYLENKGFLFVLWDFENSFEYSKTHNNLPINWDLNKIINAFLNKKYYGWMENSREYSNYLQQYILNIKKILDLYNTTTDIKIINYLLIVLLNELIKSGDLTINKPSVNKIINDKPFIFF